jgi:Predicted solute binding protein
MPPPPDQLPEDSSSPRTGGADKPSSTGTARQGATSTTSASATSPADAAKGASAGRTDDPTTRLEQPGSETRTERIPTRGTATATSSGPGAETTQPISAGSQTTLRTGRVGATQATSAGRFGFGTSGRTATGSVPGTAVGAGAVGAARVTEAVRAARTTVGSAAARGPRRARLNLKRVDPWSVMKFSFAVSLVLFIVVIVATSVLYLALDAMGVFDSVNGTLTDMLAASGGQGENAFRITAKGVILPSGLIGLVNVVLFTALATLGAFIYNVCADLVGGIEITLAERD